MLETISLYILPIMILAILCTAVVKKVPVYEEQEEILSVLNDDTLENEKFLNELKDFRKQL